MKLRPEQRVPLAEQERRALEALRRAATPLPANGVADAIWPGHSMRSQGAGGAASRVLKRLEKRGEVSWVLTKNAWGWVVLPKRPADAGGQDDRSK